MTFLVKPNRRGYNEYGAVESSETKVPLLREDSAASSQGLLLQQTQLTTFKADCPHPILQFMKLIRLIVIVWPHYNPCRRLE